MQTGIDRRANPDRFSDRYLDERRLRENVPEALGLLAEGFVAGDDDLGHDDLDRVYQASLTYLYRLVVALYAESRGLLEADDRYRDRYSIDALKRRVAEELDGPDPVYRERQTTIWDRLEELFTLLDGGSAARSVPGEDHFVPAYDGDLFETDPASGEAAAFLDSHAVGDRSLARVVELLTRREPRWRGPPRDGATDDDSVPDRGGRAFVDYSSLDVRHLGSIYEGLLEYDLEIADEPTVAVRENGDRRWVPATELADDPGPEVVEHVEPGDAYLTTETGTRKATGSYYTPAFVVEYVVERALEPLLDDIRADLDPAAPDYAEAFAERVFDLSVLDPAMGSGHFLVETVEYLAREVLRAHRERVEGSGAGRAGDAPNVRRVRRRVASRCVYGVDENGMAVELAKASLWLRTLAAEQPPAVLDHRLVQGDALAGAVAENFGPGVRDEDSNGESGVRFDAVVGNPPYVRSRNLPDDLKEDYRREFRTAEGAYDLYVPFVELATDLGGRVSLVVPNKWTTTDYGRELRDLLLDDRRLREVVDVSTLDVFPDADVYPVVVTCERDRESDDVHDIRVRRPSDEGSLASAPATTVSRSFVDRLGGRVVPLDLDPAFADLAADALARCDRFGDHVAMSEGVHTGNVREKLLVDDVEMREAAEDGRRRTDDDRRGTSDDRRPKAVGGDSVGRYRVDWDGTRLRYDESLVEREDGEYADLRDPGLFEGEKLLVRDVSDRPVAAYDDDEYYALNTLYSVRSRPESDLALRYLLGVFNSAFVTAYARQVYGGTRVSGDYLRFKPMFVEEIPVPDPGDATFDPSAIAREAGVECEVPADPEAAVATLTERLREARDERAGLNLDVLDHLPGLSANDPSAGRSASDSDVESTANDASADLRSGGGPTLAEVGVPADGVGDSILAETASDRDGLRIGEVRVDGEDGTPVVSATARYKPDGGGGARGADGRTDREPESRTDRWGYVETDPVAAMRVPDRDDVAPGRREATVALVESFVPAAAERGRGFAGFRETATKTNSPLDRLRALTLPDPENVADEVARFEEIRDRAGELDDRIGALDDAIDGIAYRLYGLDAEDVAVVEGSMERRNRRGD